MSKKDANISGNTENIENPLNSAEPSSADFPELELELDQLLPDVLQEEAGEAEASEPSIEWVKEYLPYLGLKSRERKVIRFQLGWEDRVFHTQEEAAAAYRISVARVKQIERKVWNRFQHRARLQRLKDYLEE